MGNSYRGGILDPGILKDSGWEAMEIDGRFRWARFSGLPSRAAGLRMPACGQVQVRKAGAVKRSVRERNVREASSRNSPAFQTLAVIWKDGHMRNTGVPFAASVQMTQKALVKTL